MMSRFSKDTLERKSRICEKVRVLRTLCSESCVKIASRSDMVLVSR